MQSKMELQMLKAASTTCGLTVLQLVSHAHVLLGKKSDQPQYLLSLLLSGTKLSTVQNMRSPGCFCSELQRPPPKPCSWTTSHRGDQKLYGLHSASHIGLWP